MISARYPVARTPAVAPNVMVATSSSLGTAAALETLVGWQRRRRGHRRRCRARRGAADAERTRRRPLRADRAPRRHLRIQRLRRTAVRVRATRRPDARNRRRDDDRSRPRRRVGRAPRAVRAAGSRHVLGAGDPSGSQRLPARDRRGERVGLRSPQARARCPRDVPPRRSSTHRLADAGQPRASARARIHCRRGHTRVLRRVDRGRDRAHGNAPRERAGDG